MPDFTITVKDVTRVYTVTDQSILDGITTARNKRNENQNSTLEDGSPNPEYFANNAAYMNNVFGVWGDSNYVTDDSLDECVNRALNSWRYLVVIPIVGRDLPSPPSSNNNVSANTP